MRNRKQEKRGDMMNSSKIIDSYLAFVNDAGVESIVKAIAFELHLVRWRDASVERIGAQVVAVEFTRQVRVPNVVDLWDACQWWSGGNFLAVDQCRLCSFCWWFHLFCLLARNHQRQP